MIGLGFLSPRGTLPASLGSRGTGSAGPGGEDRGASAGQMASWPWLGVGEGEGSG